MALDPTLFTPEQIEKINQLGATPTGEAPAPSALPTTAVAAVESDRFKQFQESIKTKDLGIEQPRQPEVPTPEPSRFEQFKERQEIKQAPVAEAEIESIKEDLRARNLGIEIPEELKTGTPEFKQLLAEISPEPEGFIEKTQAALTKRGMAAEAAAERAAAGEQTLAETGAQFIGIGVGGAFDVLVNASPVLLKAF